MYFLANFELGDVGGIINNALRTLTAWLCEIIYTWIAKLYQVFLEIGQLSTNDTFDEIFGRISLIIGIFMVFRVTFWLIELLLSPDKISDKEKGAGKIIFKVFAVVVLLAFTPMLFDVAYKIQSEIVDKNIIGQIIGVGNEESNGNFSAYGGELAANLFVNFYNIRSERYANHDCAEFTGEDGIHAYNIRTGNGYFNLNNWCLLETESEPTDNGNVDYYVIDFNGLFAVAVGGVVFWMILMYCISVGARYVQLWFLEIIAPIPIMCYLTPNKDNMFSKWVKQCTTTYLDLFIRIAIINFVVLLSSELFSNSDIFNNVIVDDNVSNTIKIFIVLGLLTFAKKAPDLIQELLPKSVTKASGDFGLSLKKRSEAMLGGKFMYSTAKRAPGYVAGGVAGGVFGGVVGAKAGKGVGSRLAGFASGAARGFATGSKKGSVVKNLSEVKKNQAAQNRRLQQWRIDANKGADEPNTISDWWSRKSAQTKSQFGFETQGGYYSRASEAGKKANSVAKETRSYHEEKAATSNQNVGFGSGKVMGISTLEDRYKRSKEYYNSLDVDKLTTTSEGLQQLRPELKNQYISNQQKRQLAENQIRSTQPNLNQTQMEQAVNNYLANDFETKFNNGEFAGTNEARIVAQQLIEEAENKQREDFKIWDDSKTESGFNELIARIKKGEERSKNDIGNLNSFARKYENDFYLNHDGVTSDGETLPSLNIQEIDPEKLIAAKEIIDNNAGLDYLGIKEKMEQGDANAMSQFNAISSDVKEAFETYFDAFNSYKGYKSLGSRIDAVEDDSSHLKATASDKFNSGK